MENVAIIDLEANGLPESDVKGLTERLRTEVFLRGTYNIIERSQMNEILQEQGFQQLGCTNASCAIEIGKIIGVEGIIIGSVNLIGDVYTFDLRLIDVSTGMVRKSVKSNCETCNFLKIIDTSVPEIADKLCDTQSGKSEPLGKKETRKGILVLDLFPNSTEIVIDGKSFGKGSRAVVLSPGKHRLHLNTSMKSVDKEITIYENEKNYLRLSLEKRIKTTLTTGPVFLFNPIRNIGFYIDGGVSYYEKHFFELNFIGAQSYVGIGLGYSYLVFNSDYIRVRPGVSFGYWENSYEISTSESWLGEYKYNTYYSILGCGFEFGPNAFFINSHLSFMIGTTITFSLAPTLGVRF